MQRDLFRHPVEALCDRIAFAPGSREHPVWEVRAMLTALDAGLTELATGNDWAACLRYSWRGEGR